MRFDTPLSLTVDPVLELAFREGHGAWARAVQARGTSATANWLIRRSVGVQLDEEAVKDAIASIALSRSPEALAAGQLELAELIREGDLEMSELLWQGVRDYAVAVGDADLMESATGELAAISGELKEPHALAKVWIDYLNWRRQPGSSSDPEQVLHAFDELIRAAEMSGAHRDAARYGWLQVQFQGAVDRNDPGALTGDWMPDSAPFVIWE